MKTLSHAQADTNEILRYFEIDWLRIILILAVFIHHCLMPFNGDGWHIMNADSSKLLDDIMVYFEQLRLPALFFIAGAGAFLLLNKRTPLAFIKDKLLKLLLPLMVGVILIVPPQTYIENIEQYSSYLSAYPELMLNFDTNHLWFIEFLFVFMVLAIPAHSLLARATTRFRKLEILLINPYAVLTIGILIGTIRVGMKVLYPQESHSIHNLSLSVFYALFFVFGMLFISSNKCWSSFKENRRIYLGILTGVSVVFYVYYIVDFSPYFSLQTRWSIWWFVCTLVSWIGIATMLGYAQHYLSHDAKLLRKSNQLIYPFYIFHQTVIVLIGYLVIGLDSSVSFKAVILILTSFLVTVFICWRMVYPFKFMRMLFGLQSVTAK